MMLMKNRGGIWCRGQVTAETAVGLTLVIGALVAMVVYAQRAMQGNLFQASQAHGLQFDPDDEYTEKQQLMYRGETVRQITRESMVAADLIAPVAPDPASGQGDQKMLLHSLPTGPVLRETTARESRVLTTWKAREGTDKAPNVYNVRR